MKINTQHPKYTSKTDIRYLEDIVSPITKLVSINDFHAKTGPMETKFLDTLAQHLLTNHNIYVYHKAAIMAHASLQSKPHLSPSIVEQEIEGIQKLL